MREYLVIVDMGNGFKLPLHLKAENNIEAMSKTTSYCLKEGYFAEGVEIIKLHNKIGIVEV